MLFQPTNVFPSTIGGLGNGVIDVDDDLTVSWQVNGNSAMTSFAITIYVNDTESTQLYTTGQLTTNCPFYGTDYNGDIQFFEYTISSSALKSAGLVNGSQYKLIIQQWWSSSESVTQTSASVFITRANPTVVINTIPSPLPYRAYTFSGTYTQAQGDSLMWFRWQIADADNTENPILDTGNIYGSAQLMVQYDGFFNGSYAIRLTVMTINGIEADTGWQSFTVTYSVSDLRGLLQVENYNGNVYIKWPMVRYINGTVTGNYSITGNQLILSEGATATWNTSNGGTMEFPAPYTIVWQGTMISGTAWEITGEGHSMSFVIGNEQFSLVMDSTTLYTNTFEGADNRKWLVIVTPSQIYVQLEEFRNGLYPSTTLYPSETLYPKAAEAILVNYSGELSYNTFTIESVKLFGAQTCDYVWIFSGEPNNELLQQLLNGFNFVPEMDENTYMLADFSNNDLNAGNLTGMSEPPTGVAIYRRENNNTALDYVTTVPLAITQLIDYRTTNGNSYMYYLFPVSETTFITEPMTSEVISPCCWDWTLIACDENDSEYHMRSVYYFGKNLASGNLSNNNSPQLLENFTPYPLIQLKSTNYMSGTLSSLIGTINKGKYSDTISLREEILALSSSNTDLFLKSRKGDLWRVKISAPISVTTMDNSTEQAQTLAIPWVEIADSSTASIISSPQESAWPM